MLEFGKARALIDDFKGDAYTYGLEKLSSAGKIVREIGQKAVLVKDVFPGGDSYVKEIKESLKGSGVVLAGEIEGPAPNVPLEDLDRIMDELKGFDPEVVISFGGGSTIDATKAADVLCTLGGNIEEYFGVGLVTSSLEGSGKQLIPHVAIQTAASSGAHLTKYSNITNVESGQKKLIVDEAVVPPCSIFDYKVTFSAPLSLPAFRIF